MTVKEIISGLQFTVDMFMFDPSTGEDRPYESLNDMDKTTVDACLGAIELLERQMPKQMLKNRRLYYCPSCRKNRYLITDISDQSTKEYLSRHKFCHNCGQALGWDEKKGFMVIADEVYTT